jgi:hypothetical protein
MFLLGVCLVGMVEALPLQELKQRVSRSFGPGAPGFIDDKRESETALFYSAWCRFIGSESAFSNQSFGTSGQVLFRILLKGTTGHHACLAAIVIAFI